MLAEPSHNTRAAREKAVELLFEKFRSPALFLAKNAVLASFAVGRQTSLVIDSGHNTTTGRRRLACCLLLAACRCGWEGGAGQAGASWVVGEGSAAASAGVGPCCRLLDGCVEVRGSAGHWQCQWLDRAVFPALHAAGCTSSASTAGTPLPLL
jgi:hypothetical protein